MNFARNEILGLLGTIQDIALTKAVAAADMDAITPESLEIQAHNTMWTETNQHELTILKMLPAVPASKIYHQFYKITSYGNAKGSGFISERSVPLFAQHAGSRVGKWVKLQGELADVLLLASLQRTVSVEGMANPADYEPAFARLRMLRKQNLNVYYSDDSTTRFDSEHALRYQGLRQQIREGTDGTTGTSPNGSHIIDMEGDPLNVDTLRTHTARVVSLYGFLSTLIMSPSTRTGLEGSLDTGVRINIEGGVRVTPFLLGNFVAGLQTLGDVMWFHDDTSLEWQYARPLYTATLEDGAPTTSPTVVCTAQADNATTDTVTSKWDADSAGEIFYVATEVVDEKESAGTRYPTGTSTMTVAVGEEVEIAVTPGNTQAETFRIYRGKHGVDLTDLATNASFIFEVAADSTGGTVTCWDNNLYRPRTSDAFGLNLQSNVVDALHNASGASSLANYQTISGNFENYLSATPGKKNTVEWAHLGPRMLQLELAHLIASVRRPLMCTAGTPVVLNPLQNVVFINIGQ